MKVLCTTQTGLATALGQTMRIIAVARELQRRGHEVKFLAGGKLVTVIKNHQLAVNEYDLPPMPKFKLPSGGFENIDDSRREEIMARMREIFQKTIAIEKELVELEKPDLLLCGNLTGPVAAKTFGLPCVMVFLQPHGQKTIDLFLRRSPKEETIRKQMLDVLGGVNLFIMEGMPELGGDVVIEAKGELVSLLKDKLRYTGPLLVEPPDELPGQAELKARHAGNKELPLVYLTIGGGTPLIGEEFLTLALEAFRELSGVKGVISTGLDIDPNRLSGFSPPNNVLVRSFVPGAELVKASDVTVFHGGSSTLMTCIACGRPAVVVPSMAEQEDNGAVLVQSGSGIMLEKRGLTAAELAEAVKKVLSEPAFLASAQRLRALGEKYGGAPAAADMVEKLMVGGTVH